MTRDSRLEQLERAAKEYLNKERKQLDAEYSFLEKILQVRGYSKLEKHNNDKAAELLIKSLKDFLGK